MVPLATFMNRSFYSRFTRRVKISVLSVQTSTWNINSSGYGVHYACKKTKGTFECRPELPRIAPQTWSDKIRACIKGMILLK